MSGGGAARATALSQRERESNLGALAGAGATLTPSRLRGNDSRMSNSLSLWERAGVRVARRREATLLSRVGASSFPRRREPTAPHTAAP